MHSSVYSDICIPLVILTNIKMHAFSQWEHKIFSKETKVNIQVVVPTNISPIHFVGTNLLINLSMVVLQFIHSWQNRYISEITKRQRLLLLPCFNLYLWLLQRLHNCLHPELLKLIDLCQQVAVLPWSFSGK